MSDGDFKSKLEDFDTSQLLGIMVARQSFATDNPQMKAEFLLTFEEFIYKLSSLDETKTQKIDVLLSTEPYKKIKNLLAQFYQKNVHLLIQASEKFVKAINSEQQKVYLEKEKNINSLNVEDVSTKMDLYNQAKDVLLEFRTALVGRPEAPPESWMQYKANLMAGISRLSQVKNSFLNELSIGAIFRDTVNKIYKAIGKPPPFLQYNAQQLFKNTVTKVCNNFDEQNIDKVELSTPSLIRK